MAAKSAAKVLHMDTQKHPTNPLPHANQDVSIPEYKQEDILLSDIMEVGALLVGKEQVRFPQTFEHFRVHSQRIWLEVRRKLQSGVVPALPQKDVHSVVLWNNRKPGAFQMTTGYKMVIQINSDNSEWYLITMWIIIGLPVE